MRCLICNNETKKIFQAVVLSKSVNYFECERCKFIQTENPYWLEEAYENSMNRYDTGVMQRNQQNLKIVISILFATKKLHSKLLDYAGGHGILVRMLRDYGVDAYWNDKFSKNIYAQGYESKDQNIDFTTAFEVFEHFERPKDQIKSVLASSVFVLVSTKLVPVPTPRIGEWEYYGTEHGQHVGFFRISNLNRLALESHKFLVSDGKNYHLFSDKKISKTVFIFFIRTRFIWFYLGKLILKSKTISDQLKQIKIYENRI